VFFGRGLLKPGSLPIRSYNFDGSQRGQDIDIFKDFPGVQQVVVMDISAGSGETVILSAVLNYGTRTIRHVVLTYDSNGVLRSTWDTEPYFAWAIAKDDKGHVFALENRVDEKRGTKPYPLLGEYDSSGALIRQFLDSDVFREGSAAIGNGFELDRAASSLTFQDHKLYIYAAGENEVLVCNSDGVIIKRERLDYLRHEIAEADKASIGITQVVFADDARVIVNAYDYIPAENMEKMPPNTYLVDLTTRRYSTIEGPQNIEGLGVAGGTVVMLAGTADRHASLKSYPLPTN
jgi:hypothetical protein